MVTLKRSEIPGFTIRISLLNIKQNIIRYARNFSCYSEFLTNANAHYKYTSHSIAVNLILLVYS